MVATDVASRGIGMYQYRPPPGPLPEQPPAKHMLYFTLLCLGALFHCANMPDVLACVHTVLNPWSLVPLCSARLRILLYS